MHRLRSPELFVNLSFDTTTRASISDGKIEGDHITFTATGHLDSSTGIPTCKFDVTIEGDKMHVVLSAIKNAGGPMALGYSFNYVGTRQAN
jgi:hypothetical protein